jgi:hypothetical protein
MRSAMVSPVVSGKLMMSENRETSALQWTMIP